MSIIRKKLLVTMLCVTAVHAHNEPNFFETVRQRIAATNNPNTDEPVHPSLEKLGLKAQKRVGIAHPLSIKKLNPQHSFATNEFYAITLPDAIYVNEAILGLQPFSIANCTLHHEAIHVRENDCATLATTARASGVAGLVGTYAGMRKLGITSKKSWLCFIGGWIFASMSKKIVSQIIESRADREGLKATNCTTCVHEMGLSREIGEITPQSNLLLFSRGGYISAQETFKIAKDLEGKVCDYHAQSEKQVESEKNAAHAALLKQQLIKHKEAAMELQIAEHAATDKEEHYLRRFQ